MRAFVRTGPRCGASCDASDAAEAPADVSRYLVEVAAFRDETMKLASRRSSRLTTPAVWVVPAEPFLRPAGGCVAFGAGGPVSVPAIAITADEVTFGGKVVDQVANVTGDDRFDQSMPLTEALNSWAKVRTAKVAINGRRDDRADRCNADAGRQPRDAEQLRRTARARARTPARCDVAPLREVVTPVPPIARGTGGSWNDASHGVKGDDDGERVELSLYVTPEQIGVGVSRINEFQEIVGRDWATLAAALRERKASAFFRRSHRRRARRR